MSVYKELAKIQRELKAPKNQQNKFGGYSYRSCEDILEAVKPLTDHAITLLDEIVMIGDRFYVKATVTLTDVENNSVSVSAYAREAAEKKGMDASQITGAASSYARKYALNGLFCIDDTKDSDATNEHGKAEQESTHSAKQDQVEKDWYNDFDKHKPLMIQKIKSGEETADQIIINLRKNFKLSRQIAEQIKQLEAA